ncbi:hypothetical protein GCM10007978_07650 [Shewanella hanedai]|uniref:WbqC family protein n=1 Tax=Shewanella hanedai TaxID=25 RepID=A0A553JT07_SHEHA|nr:WbqC family protein [Shewanella hanedai]TRY15596.1 WbqC family protein [Shewanella hanedai]GGI72209.1 hypothetical protein GCM10007978_07650 [Shewanella hanedai]
MILSVMQPTFLPWIGYFDLIDSADTFVFLDNVKLEKSSWQVRNRIKSAQGELMLSAPVLTPQGRLNTTIAEAQFKAGHPWRKKHLRTIHDNYRNAPYFDQLYPRLTALYDDKTTSLATFNIAFISTICEVMKIDTVKVKASELSDIDGVKDERLVSLCERLNCNQYLSPIGAMGYLEQYSPGGALVRNNIDLFYQQFEPAEYQQQSPGHISHLSVIDVLFNLGPVGAIEMMRASRRQPLDYRNITVKK